MSDLIRPPPSPLAIEMFTYIAVGLIFGGLLLLGVTQTTIGVSVGVVLTAIGGILTWMVESKYPSYHRNR
jgi:hypothetical protein